MSEFIHIGGDYLVLSTLGVGAGSTIYKVQGKDRQCYAVKYVKKTAPKEERFLTQAIWEHQVARRFDHPSLRRSYKLIKEGSFVRTHTVIVLMELVEGHTLEQRRPNTIGSAIETFRRAAEGLALMHRSGFVHADIKPNNIMITDEGQVKLIDFGQSCRTGTVKQRIQGTPDYIAPEQVHRQAITERTDIYNLGATMYWMLTKRHAPSPLRPRNPIGSRSEAEAPMQPPAEVNPRIPAALSSLVMACIERGVEHRPTSMDEVITRLHLAGQQAQRASELQDD